MGRLKRISIKTYPIIKYKLLKYRGFMKCKVGSSKKGSMFVNITNPIPNFSIHSIKTKLKQEKLHPKHLLRPASQEMRDRAWSSFVNGKSLSFPG
jgi:hypothetical protein